MKVPFRVERGGEDHFYCKLCKDYLPWYCFYESSIRGKFRRCKQCQSRENRLRYSRKDNIFRKHLRNLRRHFGKMEGSKLLEESDIRLVINFWRYQKNPPDENNSALVPWDLDEKLVPHNLMLVTKKEAGLLRRNPRRFRRLFKENTITEILQQFKVYFDYKVSTLIS